MLSGVERKQTTGTSDNNPLHALPELQKASGQSISDAADLIASLDKLRHKVQALILSHLDAPDRLALIIDQLAEIGTRLAGNPLAAIAFFGWLSDLLQRLFSNPAAAAAFISKLGGSPAESVGKVIAGGFPAVCLYELLRQSAVVTVGNEAAADDTGKPAQTNSAVRNEGQQSELLNNVYGTGKVPSGETGPPGPVVDALPVNLAFTHTGLQALQLDSVTLESFTDAFKEGMAARAERLGDTGPADPENWEGELGKSSIHGYFSGGFQAEDSQHRVAEQHWRRLCDDVRAFNGRRGNFYVEFSASCFACSAWRSFTLNWGRSPIVLAVRMSTCVSSIRLSRRYQPALCRYESRQAAGGRRQGATGPNLGSGRQGRDLSRPPDEDGNVHMQPFNCKLQHNGTFLVFRKLQQDVVGFREFLEQQRPGDNQA